VPRSGIHAGQGIILHEECTRVEATFSFREPRVPRSGIHADSNLALLGRTAGFDTNWAHGTPDTSMCSEFLF